MLFAVDNCAESLRLMMARLDVRLLRACAESLGLRPAGRRPQLVSRILHRHGAEEYRVFAVVRAAHLEATDDRSVARTLDFDGPAGRADPFTPPPPPHLAYPALFANMNI